MQHSLVNKYFPNNFSLYMSVRSLSLPPYEIYVLLRDQMQNCKTVTRTPCHFFFSHCDDVVFLRQMCVFFIFSLLLCNNSMATVFNALMTFILLSTNLKSKYFWKRNSFHTHAQHIFYVCL